MLVCKVVYTHSYEHRNLNIINQTSKFRIKHLSERKDTIKMLL